MRGPRSVRRSTAVRAQTPTNLAHAPLVSRLPPTSYLHREAMNAQAPSHADTPSLRAQTAFPRIRRSLGLASAVSAWRPRASDHEGWRQRLVRVRRSLGARAPLPAGPCWLVLASPGLVLERPWARVPGPSSAAPARAPDGLEQAPANAQRRLESHCCERGREHARAASVRGPRAYARRREHTRGAAPREHTRVAPPPRLCARAAPREHARLAFCGDAEGGRCVAAQACDSCSPLYPFNLSRAEATNNMHWPRRQIVGTRNW